MYQNLVTSEYVDSIKVDRNIYNCIENLYFKSYLDIGEETRLQTEFISLNRQGLRTTNEYNNLILQDNEVLK